MSAFTHKYASGVDHVAGIEADVDHGLVAGTMTGAWTINCELERILRVVSRQPAPEFGPSPDPQPPTIVTMARTTLEQHNRSFVLLRQLKEQLLELYSSRRSGTPAGTRQEV